MCDILIIFPPLYIIHPIMTWKTLIQILYTNIPFFTINILSSSSVLLLNHGVLRLYWPTSDSPLLAEAHMDYLSYQSCISKYYPPFNILIPIGCSPVSDLWICCCDIRSIFLPHDGPVCCLLFPVSPYVNGCLHYILLPPVIDVSPLSKVSLSLLPIYPSANSFMPME